MVVTCTVFDIMSFVSPIASALIIWYIQHQYARREKKRDDKIAEEKKVMEKKEEETEKKLQMRASARKQENLLIMRMIRAIGKLSYANSIAIKEKKVNGVMEEALVYYKDASDEMSNFMESQAVDNFNH